MKTQPANHSPQPMTLIVTKPATERRPSFSTFCCPECGTTSYYPTEVVTGATCYGTKRHARNIR
jgi:hypothetical protein